MPFFGGLSLRGLFAARGDRPGQPSRSAWRRSKRSPKTSHGGPAVESLETRTMLSATMLDIDERQWQGREVEAVRDEYVLRMRELNVRQSSSAYDHRAPKVPRGWQLESLGMGFYKLTAPGVSEETVSGWALRQNVESIDVNSVVRIPRSPVPSTPAAANPTPLPGSSEMDFSLPPLNLTSDDPLYNDAANWAFPQIQAEEAWDLGTGVETTVVAVLDSGVDYNHPDLVDNMWINPGEIPGNGLDDGDVNTIADDIHGYNAITGTGDPMDDDGQGTAVAGIIGAVGDNGLGMVGVNWDVQIMAIKVLADNGEGEATGTAANIIRGIDYVLQQRIAGQNVVAANLGFGDYAFNQLVADALGELADTGIVLAAEAGDDANDNDAVAYYPANYDIESLISVAASTPADTLWPLSNFGATTVDLAAPGQAVLATRAGAADFRFVPYNGDTDYTTVTGTAYASAFVAGTAGLLRSLKPTASATQVKQAILDGVDVVPTLDGLVATSGRLNLFNAAQNILTTIGETPVASFRVANATEVIETDYGYSFVDVDVVLDRPIDPGETASVWYETVPGGSAFENVDYVATQGYLSFSGSETQKSIRIKIVGDRLSEANETFFVRLREDRSRNVIIPGGQQLSGITILDDDSVALPTLPEPNNPLLPVVSVAVPLDEDGNEIPVREGDAAVFIVSLDNAYNEIVTVRYRTHQPTLRPPNAMIGGVDYVHTSGTLIFRPGEFEKIVTVRTLLDTISEGDETLSLVLYEPVNCQPSGDTSSAQATVTDVPPEPPSPPPAGGGFTITVSFTTPVNLSPSQQQVFAEAAARWEEIIIGDLPDVVDPTTGETIDDVLIEATATAIDGPGGILGSAGPRELRTDGTLLPWKGAMQFDTADLDQLEASGQLVDVIVHEMAHVLGFGTIWELKGLIEGAGTPGSVFTGANAVAAYNEIFGNTDPAVPLETQGGPGTADGHWSEDLFGTELMTGFLNAGVPNPISRVTVGQFEDLGYQVDYAAADNYNPALRGRGPGLALPIRMPVSRLPEPVLPPSFEPSPLPLPIPFEPVNPQPTRQPVTRTPVTRTPVSQPVGGTPTRQPVASPATRTPVSRTPVAQRQIVEQPPEQPVSTTPVSRQPLSQPVSRSPISSRLFGLLES